MSRTNGNGAFAAAARMLWRAEKALGQVTTGIEVLRGMPGRALAERALEMHEQASKRGVWTISVGVVPGGLFEMQERRGAA